MQEENRKEKIKQTDKDEELTTRTRKKEREKQKQQNIKCIMHRDRQTVCGGNKINHRELRHEE